MWLDALAIVATATGLIAVRARTGRTRAAGRWWRHPGAWLILICAALFANQVLFTVYVIRAHHGDASFIARYLPDGWFGLSRDHALRRFAEWFPAPSALSPTVLRVQAFLELPFVLAAYLTAARWLDPWLAARLLRPVALWCASAAYTIVFCLIEVSLANPYTTDDIVIRAVSGAVTPLAFGAMLSAGSGVRIASALDVLRFAVSAGCLGVLVLVVYDTTLLYNLGRVRADAPVALLAAAVLGGARLAPGSRRTGGPCLTVLIAGTCQTIGWFFVPALPVRYELQFGTRWLALTLGAVIAVCALGAALRDIASRGDDRGIERGLPARLAAVAALSSGAAMAAAAAPQPYPEGRLLLAAAAFVMTAAGSAALLDRMANARSLP